MGRRAFHLFLATLAITVLALLAWLRPAAQMPGPDPSVRRVEVAPRRAGGGSLGQVQIDIPDTIGTTIARWTASNLVTITSAAPSALNTGDQFSVWCSQTGTEASAPTRGGFVGSAYITSSSLAWSSSPSTWAACQYYAATRSAGSSTGLVLYLSGNQDSGGGTGGDSGSGSTGGLTYEFTSPCGDASPSGSCQITPGAGSWYGSVLSSTFPPDGGEVYCVWNGDPTGDAGTYYPLLAYVLLTQQFGPLNLPPVTGAAGMPYDAGLFFSYGEVPPIGSGCPGSQSLPAGFLFSVTQPKQ